jgi:hypothetical protein
VTVRRRRTITASGRCRFSIVMAALYQRPYILTHQRRGIPASQCQSPPWSGQSSQQAIVQRQGAEAPKDRQDSVHAFALWGASGGSHLNRRPVFNLESWRCFFASSRLGVAPFLIHPIALPPWSALPGVSRPFAGNSRPVKNDLAIAARKTSGRSASPDPLDPWFPSCPLNHVSKAAS